MFLKHLGVVAVFYGAHVLASIVGVVVLSWLELGTVVFDRARDPQRLALTSAVIVAPPLLLLYAFPHAGVLLFYLPLFFIVTKLAYVGMTLVELLILGFICVIGTASVGTLVSTVLALILR